MSNSVSLNLFTVIHNKIQRQKVNKLAKKCGLEPQNLPTFLQDPTIARIVLREINKKNEMPVLVFDWNDAGFNDDPTVPNCRNGQIGQTKAEVIASLTGAGAVNHDDILFSFPNGAAIGSWSNNVSKNLSWYEIRIYVLDSLMLSA
ncbi:hypothetical protein RclHR1_01470009 [Rhizophagus clarus]|uniref:Uncharacterized protein n=1 Tax=Rhizophagus clarus TaxID=94130 RepID=A0A2Z6QTZ2_9GLOM|nr:hypothetical protein RclHR1_01470009 [Rhizophagus clarus]